MAKEWGLKVSLINVMKLNEVFLPEKGWKPEDAAILTFSAGSRALNELISIIGISETYRQNMEAELAKHIWVALQKGRWSNQELESDHYYTRLVLKEKRIAEVEKDGALFHPKAIAVLYKNDVNVELKSLKIFISSRNVTIESNREAGILLETRCFNGTGNNKPLADLFSVAFSNLNGWEKSSIAQYLEKAQFSYDETIEFLTPQSGFADELIKKFRKGKDAVIVSPFLKNSDYLKGVIGNLKTYCLITTKKVSKDIWEAFGPDYLRCFAMRKTSSDENEENEADGDMEDNTNGDHTLHAKIYAIKCEDGNHLFIGSSNFSEAGLDHNYELMVHVISNKYDFCESLRDEVLSNSFELTDEAEQDSLPEGSDIPKADDIAETAEELCDSIRNTTSNDILRHFFHSVFRENDSSENAMDYAIRVLQQSDDSKKVKEWKKNLENAGLFLPEELENYKKKLSEALNNLSSEVGGI